MSVEKKKPMGAYPVTLTDGGFTLNGHEFATKPTLGQRGQNGQRAYAMPVKSGGTGRQWVIISNGKDRRRLLNPYNFRISVDQWLQSRGNPGLSRAASSAVPDPSATPTSEWTSASGSFAAVPLGLVVLGDGTIVTAQTVDDSGWELQLRVGGTTYTLAIAPPGYQIGLTDIWSDATAALAIVVERVAQQIFRKRSALLEALTLTGLDLANTYWDALNLSAGGQFSHGAYLRSYDSITGQTGGPYYTEAIVAPLGSNTATDNVEVQAWTVDVADTTIAETWGLDPETLLDMARPLVFGCTGKMPAHDNTWRLWVSARQRLDASGSAADQNLCNTVISAFPPSPSTSRSNYAPRFSRLLEARIVSLSAAGTENWAWALTLTPTTPINDSGLLGALSTRLGELLELESGGGSGSSANYYDYTGMYTGGDAVVPGPERSWTSVDSDAYYPLGEAFDMPQLSLFLRTGITLLPQSSPNNRQPIYMDDVADYGGGLIHNFEVFSEWGLEETARLDSGEEATCRNNTAGQLVVDSSGNTYAAYLAPVGVLAGGSITYPVYGGSSVPIESKGLSRNLTPAYWVDTNDVTERWWLIPAGGDWEDAIVYDQPYTGEVPFPLNPDGSEGAWHFLVPGETVHTKYYVQSKHSPDLFNFFKRYVVKVSATGSLLWTADLTQLVAGCTWYKTDSAIGGFAESIVGGVAGQSLPLGDNIWILSPCGRVVFVLADFHDLGPNFYPTTKLLILNASSGALLHTIPLYLSDATLASDVHEDDVEATQDFIAIQDQQDFILDGHGIAEVLSVSEVRYNGTPTASWTGPTGQIVHLTFTPDEGDTVDIDYTYQGPVAYRAGNRRYGVSGAGTEIRAGASGGLEWAAVFVDQTDRTTGSSVNRCVLVEMASSLSTAPTTSTHTPTVTAPQSVAVSSGHLLHLEYVGGFWTVQQI